MSFYDTYNPRAGASNNTTTSAPAQETTFNKPADMTPTQVRVANFSEDRFPDLIRALRRYYGPILEPYSGLPESESKFSDPEIVPRSQLDSATAKMVQPMSGSEGGPGPWVRITFRDREAAYKAVDDASRGELNVGGRTVIIGMWEKEGADAGLPFMMDIDTAPAGGRRMSRSGSFSGLASRRTGSISIFDEQAPATTNANGEQLSEHMSGFRVVVPKQVEFSKKDGWISGWTNLLLAKGTASAASRGNQGDNGWGSSLCRAYRYIMDEVVGFKYL